MRISALLCLAIFVAWVALALLQLWFVPFDGALFLKLSLTAAALFGVVLGVSLVLREQASDRRLRQRGYLDD